MITVILKAFRTFKYSNILVIEKSSQGIKNDPGRDTLEFPVLRIHCPGVLLD